MQIHPLHGLDPGKRITQYKVHAWDIEAGLPSNSIYAIAQTPDGYLWIGTQNGLVRYDGIQFEVYNRENTPALPGNVIRALYLDRQGRLWIGTQSHGLSCYFDRQFTNYPISRCKSLNRISGIGQDRDGNILIGSYTDGLTFFNPRLESFTVYTAPNSLPHNQVRFVSIDQNRDAWITLSNCTVKIDGPGRFTRYPSHPSQNISAPFSKSLKTVSLYNAAHKTLWLGTGSSGLFYTGLQRPGDFHRVTPFPHPTVTFAYLDPGGRAWFGTDGGGMVRWTTQGIDVLGKQNGLTCGFVYSIFQDREGSLWAGTLDGGLHQLSDSIFTTFTTFEGLEHNYIECIHPTPDGDLLIGTQNGLSRLRHGKIETLLTAETGLAFHTVRAISNDDRGGIWIGTVNGLQYYHNNTLRTFTEQTGLTDRRVRHIARDHQGDTWIGTENGLNRFNHKTGDFTRFTSQDGLSGSHIGFIYPEPDGTVWVSSETGLDRFQNNTITSFRKKFRLGNNPVRTMHRDSSGTLWLGTGHGVIRWKNSRADHFTVRRGLPLDIVTTILEDGDYLWLSGRGGVSRIKKEQFDQVAKGKIDRLQPETFDERDGLKSRWCSGHGCRTPDRRLWFPTSIGVAVINPGHLRTDYPPPPVKIEKLVADGDSYPARESLALGPGVDRLDVYFTALSFINPKKIQFQVRLDGYDEKWTSTRHVRATSYTRLPPGEYTFRVLARGARGKWSNEDASFRFRIRPYFYQTIWFYAVVVLFVVFAAFSVHWFRVRALKRHREELKREVEQRTRDLEKRTVQLETAHENIGKAKDLIEQKNTQLLEQSEKLKELDRVKSRFFANISHEIRTPLTLIMGSLEQLDAHSGEPRQQDQIKLMTQNSNRLLGLINQLLDLSKIDGGKMRLNAEYRDLIPFLKGIFSSFQPLGGHHRLQLDFVSDQETVLLYFDPLKLEKVMFNLMVNAVKFTPRGGRVTLTVRVYKKRSPGFAGISVRDNGPGIPPQQIVNVFDRFHQCGASPGHNINGTGIGLALAKELVLLHRGNIDVHSKHGDGGGTEFIVRLPFGKDHLEPGEIVQRPIPAGQYQPTLTIPIQGPGSAPHPKTPAPPDATCILVVEDNADMRRFIAGTLENHYRVEQAEDGEKGVLTAKAVIPDLIISDIMMPRKDGYLLCKELKTDTATSHIPIILLTAKASEESIIQGLGTGADDYVTKPFNSSLLLARVKNLIEIRRGLQEKIQRHIATQPAKIEMSSLDQEFLGQLRKTIEANISNPEFKLETMCDELYMSQTTLYRKVFALTGDSPKHFVQSYRLQRAAQMLKTKTGNVTEIAFAVGFSNSSYFAKCFKDKFNQSPSQFLHEGE